MYIKPNLYNYQQTDEWVKRITWQPILRLQGEHYYVNVAKFNLLSIADKINTVCHIHYCRNIKEYLLLEEHLTLKEHF